MSAIKIQLPPPGLHEKVGVKGGSMGKKNLVKLFKTLINKGLRPTVIIANAGGYDNGIDVSNATCIDGYTLELECGSGIAFNFSELRLYHPKHGRLVICEGWTEHQDRTEYIVPNRVGHKILSYVHCDVFAELKTHWGDDYYVPKWEK